MLTVQRIKSVKISYIALCTDYHQSLYGTSGVPVQLTGTGEMWQTEAGVFYIHDNAETKASDISALCTDLKK